MKATRRHTLATCMQAADCDQCGQPRMLRQVHILGQETWLCTECYEAEMQAYDEYAENERSPACRAMEDDGTRRLEYGPEAYDEMMREDAEGKT